MIDLDEIFLNILKIFFIELKFILLYCINRVTPGHRITPGHFTASFRLKMFDILNKTFEFLVHGLILSYKYYHSM